MGQHLGNPLSQAKARGEKIVNVADLGDGFGLMGLQIQPAVDEQGNFSAVLVAIGGRNSEIVGIQPVAVPIGAVAKIPLADLKALFARALDEKPTEAPEPPKLVAA